jgi:hypothetical protein
MEWYLVKLKDNFTFTFTFTDKYYVKFVAE